MSVKTLDRCTIDSSNQFWLHYLSLENSLIEISDYVSFSADNYSSYSLKTMQLIFSVCSEVDSIFKHIHKDLYGKTSKEVENLKITAHIRMLLNDFPLLRDTIVTLNLSGTILDLKPFELLFYEYELNQVKVCDRKTVAATLVQQYERLGGSWWKQYNNLKHQRLEHFKQASLFNLIHSLSALHVLNLIYAVIQDNLAISYASILIQADSIQRFPVLQVKNGGLLIYFGSLCYGCHLNNNSIYPDQLI